MSDIDLELGHRQESADGSLCSYSDEGMSCCSHFYSTAGGSYDDYSLDPEISGEASSSGRALSASEDEMEAELAQIKVAKMERECRICHLGLENSGHEVGAVIQLGCSCKDDLGAAHQNCAETWFKIKGNKTCEICNSIAMNVSCVNEAETLTGTEHHPIAVSAAASAPVTQQPERRLFWQGHRFLNFLLACMVFAFVISWLFHFNVRS